MIRAFQNISNYDFGTWIMGIIGAIISGGATGLTAIAIGVTWQKTLILVGVNAGVSLGKFLQIHAMPDPLQQALANAAVQSAKTTAAIVGAPAAADEKQP